MLNKIIIALDDGHGMETAGKRTPLFSDGSVMRENEFNQAVVSYLDMELKRCGFHTLLVAEGDKDVPLTTRVNLANNTTRNKYNKPVDFYLSVHANANTGNWGNWGGIETYFYLYADKDTKNKADIIHKYLMRGSSLKDRGVKKGDYYVLRETTMPAVLVECGFMDSTVDSYYLISDTYRRECAKEIAQALCEIHSMDYIEEGKKMDKMTNIMGQAVAVASQMVNFARKGNANPQLPFCTLEELANMFLDEGKKEGVRGDIAFSQALKETGYFKYGGIVTPSMNNYSGIGALNNNQTGNAGHFRTPREGVMAQIQHLKAYASTEKLNQPCVDPRFNLVNRGTAPYVEWLGAEDNPNKTGWAFPGKGYGKEILVILNGILQESVVPIPDWQVDGLDILIKKGIIKDKNYWLSRLGQSITVGETLGLLSKIV